jgi:hypothetical protein
LEKLSTRLDHPKKGFENYKTFLISSKSVQQPKQNRFAGTAVKGIKFSILQLMTARVTSIAIFDSNSDQVANFTCVTATNNYQELGLAADNNINALGRACTHYYQMGLLQANLEHPYLISSVLAIYFHQRILAEFKAPFNL